MKVITLWQPWASFIALGWKTIETRTHNRFNNLFGQTIAIHAGMNYDEDWKEYALPFMAPFMEVQAELMQNKFRKDCGKILCTTHVLSTGILSKRHSADSMIDCENTVRYGLFLDELRMLQNPISIKGHQGIWNYDGEIIY